MKFIDVNGHLINLDLVQLINYNKIPANGVYYIEFWFNAEDSTKVPYKSTESRLDALKQLKQQIDKLNGEN